MNGLEYNSQRPPLKVNEYGRNLQGFLNYILKVENKEKRTELIEALVISVLQINPHLKEVENGSQIVWNYLHVISDFKLGVDSPYPMPEIASSSVKPQKLSYPSAGIKYRYYGKNLQLLVKNALKLEDKENKKVYIDLLGSFMKNSGKNWNDDFVSDQQIVAHLKVLSDNQINLTADEINADMELLQRNTQPLNNFRKGNKKRNNHKFNNKNRRR